MPASHETEFLAAQSSTSSAASSRQNPAASAVAGRPSPMAVVAPGTQSPNAAAALVAENAQSAACEAGEMTNASTDCEGGMVDSGMAIVDSVDPAEHGAGMTVDHHAGDISASSSCSSPSHDPSSSPSTPAACGATSPAATAEHDAALSEPSSDDCSQSSSCSSNSGSSQQGEEADTVTAPGNGVAKKTAAVRPLLLPPVESALNDHTTLILFDWDDTLLASTHLANSNYRLDEPDVLPNSVTEQLSLLEDVVISVLDLARALGDVCIITNAETGWVELSCRKFLPRVMPHVEQLNIVSARSTFEPRFPNLPSKWKLEAFAQRMRELHDEAGADANKNVISLGDSHAERDAVRTVTRGLPAVLTKSVKFVERPTLEQLLRELQLLRKSFAMICEARQDLDLALTVDAVPVPVVPSTLVGQENTGPVVAVSV